MIRFIDIHKAFADRAVLRGVNLEVGRATVHYVIGESGAGKSVLIKQVVGLVRPDRGSITFGGRDLGGLDESGFRDLRRACQMVFQNATLFDGLTLLENVAMPIRKRFGSRPCEARMQALAALERVRAAAQSLRLPSEVGLGVRKRVAIARALALAPEAILYDEPTTGLDPVSARRTDRLIREAADTLGITSLVVSHDLQSVRSGDRVSLLHGGRVCFEGTPGDLFAAAVEVVRRFVHGDR